MDIKRLNSILDKAEGIMLDVCTFVDKVTDDGIVFIDSLRDKVEEFESAAPVAQKATVEPKVTINVPGNEENKLQFMYDYVVSSETDEVRKADLEKDFVKDYLLKNEDLLESMYQAVLNKEITDAIAKFKNSGNNEHQEWA